MKNYEKYFSGTTIYIKIVDNIRKLVKKFGGELLTQKEHKQLLKHRSWLISELLEFDHSNLEKGLSCIIFSKNRALQLYALLETYIEFVNDAVPLTIIYYASNKFHQKAYNEVANLSQKFKIKIEFVKEESTFRESLLSVLAGIRTKNLFFLTDDNLFIREVSLKYASLIDPLHSILTFRHSPHLRYCYTAGVKQKSPDFIPIPNESKLMKFNWFEQGNHWSDPWSLDGHVFSTLEVQILSRMSDFQAPNTYESMLKSFNDLIINRYGVCYAESIIVNLPINRVQSEFRNKSGTISQEFLLEQWNKGFKLDTRIFKNLIPESTHEEHSISFQKRELFPSDS